MGYVHCCCATPDHWVTTDVCCFCDCKGWAQLQGHFLSATITRIVSHCIILCVYTYIYFVSHCIALYYIVLHNIVLYCIASFCTALYCIVLYQIESHCVASYCLVSHHTVSYCIESFDWLTSEQLPFLRCDP